MKRCLGIITISLILFSIFAGSASAVTANKDLPEKQAIEEFSKQINSNSTSGFIKTAYETSMSEHPSWKWDVWGNHAGKRIISFYYTANTTRGYGSMYFNNTGAVIKHPRIGTYDKVLCYFGV
jgi:hypothetical protein